MREAIRDKNRLEHIIDHIDKVLDAAEGKTFAQFNADLSCSERLPIIQWS